MTDEPEAIDGTATEIPADDTPAPAPSMELEVPTGNSGAIIRADDPEEILLKAHQIAKPLKQLIESAGLAANVGGRRKHVEVGGWQACGSLLGALGGQPLHAETIWTRPVKDDDGTYHRTAYTATVKRYHKKDQGGGLREEVTYDVDGLDWEARVEIRTASSIVVGVSEGMVSRAEETWNQRDDYALRSMAETRAESRAWRKAIGWIVHLAGYNPTPAEEMGHTPGAEPAGPPFGEEATKDAKGLVGQAIFRLLEVPDAEPPDVQAIAAQVISDSGGYFPAVVAKALLRLDAELTKRTGEPA